MKKLYKGIPVTVHYIGEKRSLVSSEFEEEFSIWTKDLEKVTIEKDITPKEEIIMTNIKRVNAGFKSVGEMAQAMFDGTTLHINGYELKYNSNYSFIYKRCCSGHSTVNNAMWNNFAEMEIEKEVMWWEDIDEDNPPLCKVWDISESTCSVVPVCERRDKETYPFKDIYGVCWGHAIPTGLFKKDIDALGG